MELIRRLVVATAVNVAALAVTAWAFTGVHVDGWGALIFAGIVFGIVNTVIKPVVTLLALPVILLSLGIALFFVNMLMLALTDWVVNGLVIDGFGTLAGATLLVWLVNVVLESIFGVRGHARGSGRGRSWGRRELDQERAAVDMVARAPRGRSPRSRRTATSSPSPSSSPRARPGAASPRPCLLRPRRRSAPSPASGR